MATTTRKARTREEYLQYGPDGVPKPPKVKVSTPNPAAIIKNERAAVNAGERTQRDRYVDAQEQPEMITKYAKQVRKSNRKAAIKKVAAEHVAGKTVLFDGKPLLVKGAKMLNHPDATLIRKVLALEQRLTQEMNVKAMSEAAVINEPKKKSNKEKNNG
jgi:hypothetical protein